MSSPKVIRSEESEIPHGTEYQSEVEICKADGTPIRIKQFMRKIDLGDSYTIVSHMARDAGPANIAITTGIKGAASGEYRVDQVEIVLLGSDGTVVKLPSKEVKVLLKNPFEGMSLQETLRQFGLSVDVKQDELNSSSGLPID